MEDLPMWIWKEKMNVGFVWSLAPKWSCLTAVMQCASNAIAIGNCFIPMIYLLCFLDKNYKHFLLSKNGLVAVWSYRLMVFFPNCRNTKSESCPFCRGNLKRVKSEDLWVLPCNDDIVDAETVSKEDLLRFSLYINSLPKDYPDALFLVYYEYLIWFQVNKRSLYSQQTKCRPSIVKKESGMEIFWDSYTK